MGGQVSVKSVLFSPAGWICSLQVCTACYCNSSHGRCSRCSSLQRWVCRGEVSMGDSLLCSGAQGALIHHRTSASSPHFFVLPALACAHMHAPPNTKTQMHRLSLLPGSIAFNVWAGTNPGLFPILVILLCTKQAAWFLPQSQKSGFGQVAYSLGVFPHQKVKITRLMQCSRML